jgi:hypothetical protein
LILIRVGELHAARPAPLPMRIAETEASLLLNGRLFNDLLCNTNYSYLLDWLSFIPADKGGLYLNFTR